MVILYPTQLMLDRYLGLKYFSALIRIFFTMRNIMGDGSGGRDDNMPKQETDPRHLLPRLFASNLRIFLPWKLTRACPEPDHTYRGEASQQRTIKYFYSLDKIFLRPMFPRSNLFWTIKQILTASFDIKSRKWLETWCWICKFSQLNIVNGV